MNPDVEFAWKNIKEMCWFILRGRNIQKGKKTILSFIILLKRKFVQRVHILPVNEYLNTSVLCVRAFSICIFISFYFRLL